MTAPPPTALSHNGAPLRVLHCPWNVAGQSAQLAAAERALGADSRSIVISETAKGFPADEALTRPGAAQLQLEWARWRLLGKALRWADVVHFTFGQGILVPHAWPDLRDVRWTSPSAVARRLYARMVWLKDLPILAAAGKRIVVTWQGDDARQHDRSLELFESSIAHVLGTSYYPLFSDEWKRRTIAAFERFAPVHYALNPDLMHVLPARTRFLPYASFDPAAVRPRFPQAEQGRPLVFAHAPSHRGAKGTEQVLAAVEHLRAEGLVFELDLVEGLSRDEAINRYARCDVMIDQLIVGWYGGLAVEAMSLGKPVVVYLRDGDLGFLPRELRADLPFVRATPDGIADAMRRLIATPRSEIAEMGRRSRAFVERWHDPRKVAERTLTDYAGAT